MKNILLDLYYLRRQMKFPYRHYMDKKKCIFIHIPKSAGTSILALLGNDEVKQRDHLPWYIYRKANQRKFEQYFKFSFVRNPIDRAFSAYSYLEKGGNLKADFLFKEELKRFQGFDDFVQNGLGKGLYRNMPLFIPQSQYIVGNNQKLAIDYLGRYETINDDFEKIANRLELESTLPRVNLSKNKREMKLSEKGAEVLKGIYLQDFINFGYSQKYKEDGS